MQQKNTVYSFICSLTEEDAKGFGALEHPTATTVVLPEVMPKEEVKSMMDVVSHEFFISVTPLSIHSKEIQDFDYNDQRCLSIYGCMKE
jgi:predicted metalloprotease with PDZ domain